MRRLEILGVLLVLAGFFGGMFILLMRLNDPIIIREPLVSSPSFNLECPEAILDDQSTMVHATFTNSSDRTERYHFLTQTEGMNEGWTDMMPYSRTFSITLAAHETTTMELTVPAEPHADTISVAIHAISGDFGSLTDETAESFHAGCYITLVENLWLAKILNWSVGINLSAGVMLLGIALLAKARRPLKEKRKRFLLISALHKSP